MGLLVALFAILLVQLALDLARVRVARDDVRKGVRVFRGTLRAVLRRPWQVLAIWLPLAAAFVLIAALYLDFRGLLPAGGGLLFVLFLAQQLVMIARAGMRVARGPARSPWSSGSGPPPPSPPASRPRRRCRCRCDPRPDSPYASSSARMGKSSLWRRSWAEIGTR